MNVASLNNLGLPKPVAARDGQGKNVSEKSDKPAFERVLGGSSVAPVEGKTPDKQERSMEREPSATPAQTMAAGPRVGIAPVKTVVAHEPVEDEDAIGEEESLELEKPVVALDERFAKVGVPLSPALAAKMGERVLPGQKAVVSAPAVMPESNALTRRVVWNDFLRKMNGLGVSADDVLHAFGSLNEKELAQSPEQSVDKLVMALGLQGPQANMAKQFFGELIARTKSQSMGEELNVATQQTSLSLLGQHEVQKKQLAKGLDTMNRDFFRNPAAPEQKMQALEAAPAAAAAQSDDTMKLDAPEATPLARDPLATAAVPPEVAALNPAGPAPVTAKAEMNALVEQMQPVQTAEAKAIDQVVRNFSARPTPAAAAAVAGQAVAPTASDAKTPTATPANAQVSAALSGIFAGAGKGKNSNSDDNDASDDSSAALNNALASETRAPGAQVKGEFQAQVAAQGKTAAPTVMGVPDFVQQAHVMVREGGGDMKVTLHPDGLGEVAMRVSVNDGKVTVQMVTESDEAKKLIERQIGDLKTSLVSHQLQVESIKVDTASGLKNQLEQQYQDAQRQNAQANMEQFRQDHQGWRRSFFEPGSANPYASQGEGPRDLKAPAAARNKSAGSRRLDLVA